MADSTLPPVTSLGSGSSLPLQDILDKLQANEEQQLTLIKSQQTTVATQISAYGQLQVSLEALQKAAAALTNPATYNTTKADVTGDGFTATTKGSAVAGTHSIQVMSLATAETLQSGAFTDRTAQMGKGGKISVTLADGTTASVDLGSDTSLNGVVKAINSSDTIGVRASVVNDGNGNSYLTLTSSDTGTKAAVTKIEVTGNDGNLQAKIGYDAAGPASNMKQLGDAATDAVVVIDNITVTSGSNTVDTALDGVTLNLTAKMDDPGSLRLSSDTTAVASAVHAYVTAYNTLRTQISSLTSFDATKTANSDADTAKDGPLSGDATARSIQTMVASALRVLTSTGSIKTIQDLGIETDTTTKDGTLTVDDDVLTKALVNNTQDVKNILSGTGGLGDLTNQAMNQILQTGGMLSTRTDGLKSTADNLQDNFDSASDRIDAEMANMRAKFVALDSFVAQMNSTSSYLTQQFAALTKSS